MLIVADDIERTGRELTAGELACPDCQADCAHGATPAADGYASATAAARSVPVAAAAADVDAPTCS